MAEDGGEKGRVDCSSVYLMNGLVQVRRGSVFHNKPLEVGSIGGVMRPWLLARCPRNTKPWSVVAAQ